MLLRTSQEMLPLQSVAKDKKKLTKAATNGQRGKNSKVPTIQNKIQTFKSLDIIIQNFPQL
ncbi:hypothetical protein C0J52_19867 [Blattella germanica]|nr:hypothetical protein C0J52_19867 [Blattella germanica]